MQQSTSSDAELSCYHCGDPVPAGSSFSLDIDGIERPMCCPGCRAVAGLIRDSGMQRFYAQRTAYSVRPESQPDSAAFTVYDDAQLLEQFSTVDEHGIRQISLLIGGVTCAACTWLIEGTLKRLPAVAEATLNMGLNRLDVRLEPSMAASELFARIAALGYSVRPWHAAHGREQARQEQRRDLRRLAVAGVGMMQVGMFAIALHAGDLQGISADYRDLMRWVSLIISGLVVLFGARGFFESAWRHIRQGALVMDLPVALAIGLAWTASAGATISGAGDVYFDSVVMFTFFLLLARFLERRLRLRDALAWQDAEDLLPDAVQFWSDGTWVASPRTLLSTGDRVLVRAGDTIPIDGTVCSGTSTVREDSFNGETLGRAVAAGDTVFAGTVNLTSPVELRATVGYEGTRLAALQRSIERARHGKPELAHLADRIAGHFIAAVLLIATGTFAYWWQSAPDRALWISIAVLVVSCPCALSLATPAALASASSALRRRGVMLHGENALEALPRCTHMLFDKTGTLTSGALRLETVRVISAAWDADAVRSVAAALQRPSNHPIATAFAGIAADREVEAVSQRVGAGVSGQLGGETLRMGAASYCRDLHPAMAAPEDSRYYWVGLCSAREPIAWIGLADDTRPEAAALISALQREGLVTELLTGDASARAAALGEELAMDEVLIGQTPEQKLTRVAELQASGAVVTMVGDGLNDAPVLGLADISIAVADASDLARAQADIVLLRGDLGQILRLRGAAQRTRHVIRQNFAWALGYNALGIPLAALGLVPPWAAAIGMSLSSLLVVGNSLRLRAL